MEWFEDSAHSLFIGLKFKYIQLVTVSGYISLLVQGNGQCVLSGEMQVIVARCYNS